eukprot:scaffold3725_cov114-Cylindrotheca_fusiformis.AAC.1
MMGIQDESNAVFVPTRLARRIKTSARTPWAILGEFRSHIGVVVFVCKRCRWLKSLPVLKVIFWETAVRN